VIFGKDVFGRSTFGQMDSPSQTAPVGSQWLTPARRGRVSAAVLATTMGGFVAPPQAQAPPQFSSFAQPVKARTPQQQAWLRTPFAPPQPSLGFAEFSRPGRPQVGVAAKQPGWGFVGAPASVPFSGFFEFGRPAQTRFNVAVQLASVVFEVNPPLVVPPGGTSRKLIVETDQPKRKPKTGLEPLIKRPKSPEPAPPSKLVPKFRAMPAVLPVVEEPPLPQAMPGIVDQTDETQRQIQDAIDASDIEAFLKGIDQDEWDATDIADVLALLDQQPGKA
jgi:hypothetical protein